MNDLHDEGYGAGMLSLGWLATVAGRFLSATERAELAAGWKAGLADVDAFHADMQQADAEAAAWSEGRDEPLPVACESDEFPW